MFGIAVDIYTIGIFFSMSICSYFINAKDDQAEKFRIFKIVKINISRYFTKIKMFKNSRFFAYPFLVHRLNFWHLPRSYGVCLLPCYLCLLHLSQLFFPNLYFHFLVRYRFALKIELKKLISDWFVIRGCGFLKLYPHFSAYLYFFGKIL